MTWQMSPQFRSRMELLVYMETSPTQWEWAMMTATMTAQPEYRKYKRRVAS